MRLAEAACVEAAIATLVLTSPSPALGPVRLTAVLFFLVRCCELCPCVVTTHRFFLRACTTGPATCPGLCTTCTLRSPAGVHLKALETYALVLSRLPPASLVSSLPLFATGLFPLLSYASTALKPTILSLFESHLVPLPPHALAPFLDATVVALLPAIDDDGEPGGEVHARASRLLADLSAPAPAAVDTALWRALLTAPPVRLAAARQLRGRLLAAGPAEMLSARGGAGGGRWRWPLPRGRRRRRRRRWSGRRADPAGACGGCRGRASAGCAGRVGHRGYSRAGA